MEKTGNSDKGAWGIIVSLWLVVSRPLRELSPIGRAGHYGCYGAGGPRGHACVAPRPLSIGVLRAQPLGPHGPLDQLISRQKGMVLASMPVGQLFF